MGRRGGGAGLGGVARAFRNQKGRNVGRAAVFAGIWRVFPLDANLRSDFRGALSLAACNWRILNYFFTNPGHLQLATINQGWAGGLPLRWVARKRKTRN